MSIHLNCNWRNVSCFDIFHASNAKKNKTKKLAISDIQYWQHFDSMRSTVHDVNEIYYQTKVSGTEWNVKFDNRISSFILQLLYMWTSLPAEINIILIICERKWKKIFCCLKNLFVCILRHWEPHLSCWNLRGLSKQTKALGVNYKCSLNILPLARDLPQTLSPTRMEENSNKKRCQSFCLIGNCWIVYETN